MSFSWTRVRAILIKELRDYRRNRSVIGTMAATPVLFIILPTIQLIAANVTGKEAQRSRWALASLHAGDPGNDAVRRVRLLGGRRARAGHA